ncbi:enoyl-CoA hydratase/isomerase family protein [Streptomyces sp. NPDC051913]|uniref:enoyl-CoA hydratase/isomerase family protein n=1 Tax=Streptomyces sp. NPDC051913 TaxID=3365676 RepID=UPI0037D1AAE2
MTSSLVHLHHHAGLAELVLNAPERSNALDLDLARQLRDATAELGRIPGLRTVLLRAEGKNFCVGGDLRSFAAQGERLGDYVAAVAETAHEALEHLSALTVPVVSAVQGAVAGAGVGLAFCADVVVVARSTRIRLAYTAVGLSPDMGSSWILPRLLGPRRALELALTNRVLGAEEAVAWGMASHVVDDADLSAHARDIVSALAEAPAEALAVTKRLFRHPEGAAASLRDQLSRESELISSLASSGHARSAIQGFVRR